VSATLLSTLRRLLLLISALAIAWGAVVILTGGLTFALGPVRVSSHGIVNPLLVALTATAAAALPLAGGRRGFRTDVAQALHPATLVAFTGGLLFIYQWAVARPLWLDEQMIALNIRERTLSDLAHGLWLGQSAPFGWLAAERAVLLTFGDGERAMRAVPLLFALGTVVAAWWIGRRWMNGPAATLLVLVCSFGQWVSFYSLELKHYSADVFWSLLLPALAAWALEESEENGTAFRRAPVWWLFAAVGQLFSNGALLVTPGVAAVLFVLIGIRHGARRAAFFAGFGLLWIASFALHYLVAIRHALSSAYLGEYWTFAFPPQGHGAKAVLLWLFAQGRPLALKPGGTGLWLLFWGAALWGFAWTRKRALGLLFFVVAASAFVFAAMRLVPMYERLSLWMIPSMYVGVALLLDRSMENLRGAVRRPTRFVSLIAAAMGCAAACVVAADVVWKGISDFKGARPPDANHRLDDRSTARWLIQQVQPGDVLVTTHLALPALWWYGNLQVVEAERPGRSQPEHVRLLEVSYEPDKARCARSELADHLYGASRALVFYGFRFDDVPKGFDELLLHELSDAGAITEFRAFAGDSRAAVVDLRARAAPVAPSSSAPSGCVLARPARRW
jgi:hypothetical protein